MHRSPVATACCPSVYMSVTMRYADHIGWNILEIIARLNPPPPQDLRIQVDTTRYASLTSLWATKSEGVGLIVRAISFQNFQPM